jgi:hypothetical protein
MKGEERKWEMKIKKRPRTVFDVEVSFDELQAIAALIGPLPYRYMREMGLEPEQIKLLESIYGCIKVFKYD